MISERKKTWLIYGENSTFESFSTNSWLKVGRKAILILVLVFKEKTIRLDKDIYPDYLMVAP